MGNLSSQNSIPSFTTQQLSRKIIDDPPSTTNKLKCLQWGLRIANYYLPKIKLVRVLILFSIFIISFHFWPNGRITSGYQADNVADKTSPKPHVFFRTYGDSKFAKSTVRIQQEQEANGTGWFTSVEGLGPNDLPLKFRELYKDILSLSRSGDYYIWKIAVIEMAIDSMNEGDILVYADADAGCHINKKGATQFQKYLQALQESSFDMICSVIRTNNNKTGGGGEEVYTTEAIFQALNVTKDDPIQTSAQIISTCLFLQKGNHLHQWLAKLNQVLMQDPLLLTDKYNNQALRANPKFKDNRHDQSVFSVTRKQMGVNCELLPAERRGEKNPIWMLRIRE